MSSFKVQFALLTKRRFAPLFATNLLDVVNDNLFKTGLLIMASYGLYRALPNMAAMLATVATGVFILPFFLFSALGGQVADAWERARTVKLLKGAEVAIMAIGLVGFQTQSILLLLFALFLLGVHSAMYGPLKYAILPQQLRAGEILGATGMMEAGSFVAILTGQLLGGLATPLATGVMTCGFAGVGFLASLAIAPAPPAASGGRIDLNIPVVSYRLVRMALAIRPVRLAVFGIAWFYAVGAILLGELIPLVQGVLRAPQSVAVLFLTIFSVGVALGALGVNRLLNGEVSPRFAPVSLLALAAFLLDLAWTVSGFHSGGRALSLTTFLATPASWRMALDLAGIAVGGGVFVIPLLAVLQTQSPPEERSRILAGNNIVNAGVTVGAIAVAGLLLQFGVSIAAIVAMTGVATLAGGLFGCVILPETVVKSLVRWGLRRLYRVELHGAQNMPQPDEGAVVVANHVSFLDAALLAAFLPGRPSFAINPGIFAAWWMKPVLPFFDAFPVDAASPLSIKAMVKAVREGRTLVVFPEGRITETGGLMKVFAGSAMVADKAGAPLVAVRVDGPQYSRFSLLKGKMRMRRFPRVRLTVLPPERLDLSVATSSRKRRVLAAERLYQIMSGMMFATSDIDRTLFQALLDARTIHGAKAAAVEDAKRIPLTYDRLIVGARVLGRALEAGTALNEAVGLMLPNVNAGVAAFFALQATGRVAAMLNYTAGAANLQAACDAAAVKMVVTSRAFVEQAKLEAAVQRLEASGRRIIWLEDVAEGIGALAKLRGLLADRFAADSVGDPNAPAAILFTSGSEGAPKGVALSHRNLLANCAQVAARIDFNPTDRVMNALPMFHAFGLTGATLLPILNGVRTLLYPNPLHHATVVAFVYDAKATILFGSDTFLSGYARVATPYDFFSLRYIFAGAEPVRPETRAVFSDKFGLRLLEGYGVTECSPVIAVNSPMHSKTGTVGQLVPGLEARLEDVDGIEEGRRLVVRGPNVMAGYYHAEAPGVLAPPEDGWHDTGDVVTVDEEGFVTIRGRVKRFAKIGGEMVSLAAVEGYAAALWPDAAHAVVARPDARKGEQLVLFTTASGAKASTLLAWGRDHGVAELALPRDVRVLEALPLLGSGKPDYVTMRSCQERGNLSAVGRPEGQKAGGDPCIPSVTTVTASRRT